MKKSLIISRFILPLISFALISCAEIKTPTGFIAAADIDAPRIKILSPSGADIIKDSLMLQFEVLDVSENTSLSFSFKPSGRSWSALYAGKKGNIYTYKFNVSQFNGTYTLTVSASDGSQNTGSASITLNIASTIENIYAFKVTNEVSIYTILEDKIGTVWFATFNGLWKYNNISLNLSPTGFDLSRPAVSNLAVDSKNVLWMIYKERYTSESPRLVAYNGYGIVGNYYIGIGSTSSFINSMVFDKNDSLWGTIYDGFHHCFSFKDNKWTSYYNSDAYYIAVDNNNRKWIAISSNVQYLDESGWHNTNYPSNYCNGFTLDAQNNVYAIESGTNKTKRILKYSNGTWTDCTLFSEARLIKSLAFDKKGNLWVAADGALWKFDQQMKMIRKYPINPNYIYPDSKGRIWFYDEWGVYFLKAE